MNPRKEVQTFAFHLLGQPIGTIHRRMDYTWLTFGESYILDPKRAVLGLHFEEDLRAKYPSNSRLTPWLSNLLPEGALREWIAEARGVSAEREMELLAEVGHDLPGAVQIIDNDDTASRLRREQREVLANHSRPFLDAGWRFSLSGVGLKFSMLAKNAQFSAPRIGEHGDWIIKLPDRKHPAVPLNEFAMMTLASKCGIEVPEIRLVNRDEIQDLPDEVWHENERIAYAIRRFDRTSERTAIHIEDLAQVRGFYPEDKYMGTFETVAALIYRGRDIDSLLEFVRRFAFNLLIKNGDAHLKNWSLIYRNPRVPTLAPAYDLVATSCYQPHGTAETTGLKFCGTRRFERITPACFTHLQEKLGVAVSLKEEAEQLVERILIAWPAVKDLFGDHPKMAATIEDSIHQGAKRLRVG